MRFSLCLLNKVFRKKVKMKNTTLIFALLCLISCNNNNQTATKELNDSLIAENVKLKNKIIIDSLKNEISRIKESVKHEKTPTIDNNWKTISKKIETQFGKLYVQESKNETIRYNTELPYYFYVPDKNSIGYKDARLEPIKRIVIEANGEINSLKLVFKEKSHEVGFMCCLSKIEYHRLSGSFFYKAGGEIYRYFLKTRKNEIFDYVVQDKDMQFLRDAAEFRLIKGGKYNGMLYAIFFANQYNVGWTYYYSIINLDGKQEVGSFNENDILRIVN